ncbi:predicted protein [Verticillium alfalfae VaMs.102]|uniref:Predicted protein n=1 Tax=Verticillium alfalfae (strain VaMs.102 / ATCC MYA-4576 / FGSC 10136) TaxID=526221 RepID=C9SI51_VERA1|nr:predicted protein [Verticillium alfalfae VaMs.102]EEY18624.1 predicted protein [Verticillium alfalfae VaMs.102]
MLTAIGRVAIQRLAIRAAPSSTLCRAAPIASRIPGRTFTTTHWARLPANKVDEGAEKPVKKAKKTTKPAMKEAAPKKKKKAAVKTQPEKEVRELKKIALLKEPKKLPETVWTLFTTQNIKSGEASLGERSKQLAEEYRLLDAAETERLTSNQRLKDLAEKNKVANNAAYKAWVESHTPAEIVAANNARNVLRRKVNKGRGVTHRFPIRDERLPKRPTTVYNLFFKARWASGDFSGSVTEATRTIAEEYKQLSEEQRQVYEDLATADFERYARGGLERA